MITEPILYWITRLDYINHISFAVALISGIAAMVLLIVHFVTVVEGPQDEEIKQSLKKSAKPTIVIWAISVSILVFTPTTKEMAAIWVIPKVINSDTTQEIGKEFLDLSQQWLDELKPKKEE